MVSRMGLLMLGLMDDGMLHHRNVIVKSVAHRLGDRNPNMMPSDEFQTLLTEFAGHGGVSVEGKCSVCLRAVDAKAN